MPSVGNYTGTIPLYDIISKLIPGSIFLLSIILVSPSQIFTKLTNFGTIFLIACIPSAYTIGLALQGYSGASLSRTQKFQQLMNKARDDVRIENLSNLGNTVSLDDEILASGGEHRDRKVWIDIVSRFELPTSFLYTSSEEKPDSDSNKPVSYYIFIHPILFVFDTVSAIDLGKLNRAGVTYGSEQRGFQLARSFVLANQPSRISRFSSLYVLHRSLVITCCFVFVIYFFTLIAYSIGGYTETFANFWIIFSIGLLSFFSIPIFFNGMIRYDTSHDKEIIYNYYSYVVGEE